MTEEEAKTYHDYIQDGGKIELNLPGNNPNQTAI